MSIWSEGNKIDSILSDIQQSVTAGETTEVFIENKKNRKKARKQLEEVIGKHYTKKGNK